MSRLLLVKPDMSFGIEISPPLGLAYLAASAREAGHEVRILDNRMPGQEEHVLDQTLTDWKPDVVGFSAFSYEAEAVQRLAGKVKNTLPDSTILVGGPLASADPETALESGLVNYCVLGESENTLIKILKRLQTGEPVTELDALAYRANGKITVNPILEYNEDLNSLPFPAWDLLDMDAYNRVPRQGFLYKHKRYFPVFTSRGCPYHCIYCHNVFGKRFRPRTADNVLEEIELLINRYGIGEIHFIDDIFNFKKDRATAILQGILDRGWNLAISYPNGVRTDLLDEELIDLMHRAGTYKVSVAIESGTRRIQKLIRKNLKFEKARENIGHLVNRGILTHAFFMLGFPTETPEEMKQTIDFAMTIPSHSASFFIVNPFKGTELAEMVRQSGKQDASSLGASNYFDPRVADLKISEVPAEELRSAVSHATRNFYLKRPGRILRILRDVPRKSQLLFLAFLVIMRAFLPGSIHLERRLILGKKGEKS